jgi:hypothetical protein
VLIPFHLREKPVEMGMRLLYRQKQKSHHSYIT